MNFKITQLIYQIEELDSLDSSFNYIRNTRKPEKSSDTKITSYSAFHLHGSSNKSFIDLPLKASDSSMI